MSASPCAISECTTAVAGLPGGGTASISMTTNAIGLDHRILELVEAGLTRINISLDTVDRDHFARLTRRDRLPSVFAGIQAAKDAGLTPLKINAVLMRDTLAGAADLLEWSLANGVRFALSRPHREDPSALVSRPKEPCAPVCSATTLFGDDETDLRALLRNGSEDATIAQWWRAAQWGKQAGHGMDRADFVRPQRSMGAIGG